MNRIETESSDFSRQEWIGYCGSFWIFIVKILSQYPSTTSSSTSINTTSTSNLFNYSSTRLKEFLDYLIPDKILGILALPIPSVYNHCGIYGMLQVAYFMDILS
jgi:hypothetical protein